MRARVSTTCPRATKKPCLRKLAVAALRAAGTESASAQGQVTTNTDKVTQNARGASYHHQKPKTTTQITSNRATKNRAILSAAVTCVGFSSAACAANRSMAESCVAEPVAVTRTTSGLTVFMVPAITASPTRLDTGLRSPVKMASTALLSAASTVPSQGKVSPAFTSTQSSTCKTLRRTCG